MSSEFKNDPDEKVKGLVIEPYGNRFYALYDGKDLVCVTVYKKGAMEVIGYCRVSTDEQVSNRVSLEAQEEKIRAYCKAKDWDLLDIVRDEGISAKNLNRPGLQSILGRVSTRPVGQSSTGLPVGE